MHLSRLVTGQVLIGSRFAQYCPGLRGFFLKKRSRRPKGLRERDQLRFISFHSTVNRFNWHCCVGTLVEMNVDHKRPNGIAASIMIRIRFKVSSTWGLVGSFNDDRGDQHQLSKKSIKSVAISR